jgi:hypothetical protein
MFSVGGYFIYMSISKDKRSQDLEREHLLRQMGAAEASGNTQEIADALAAAKCRLRNNYPGDNQIRKAQSRLLGMSYQHARPH